MVGSTATPTAIYSILLRFEVWTQGCRIWGHEIRLNEGNICHGAWFLHFYNEEISCGFLRSAHPRGSCRQENFWLVHSSHDFQLFISSFHHLKLKHVEQDWTWTQSNLVQRYVTTCAKWRVGCLNKKLTTCCPILARNSRLETHLPPSMHSQFNFSALIRPLATCTITKDD